MTWGSTWGRRLAAPVRLALDDAKEKGAESIDHVVLVGAMARMPAVQQKLRELTGKEPHRGVNPDEVVALGAAIMAGVPAGDHGNALLLDVTPRTLGIETTPGVPTKLIQAGGGGMTKLVDRNTAIPTREITLQAVASDGEIDSTSLTVGIETAVTPLIERQAGGGVMTKLIARNTTVPTSKNEVFSTVEDNQSWSRSTCYRASARWRARTGS